MWDIGGGFKIKHLWGHYMENANCLIFVIDVSAKDRINEYIESFQVLLDQYIYNNIEFKEEIIKEERKK
jgi:GTPase SAR1 family protein